MEHVEVQLIGGPLHGKPVSVEAVEDAQYVSSRLPSDDYDRVVIYAGNAIQGSLRFVGYEEIIYAE